MSIITPERAAEIRKELCEKHPGTWLHHYHEAIEAEVLEQTNAAGLLKALKRLVQELNHPTQTINLLGARIQADGAIALSRGLER